MSALDPDVGATGPADPQARPSGGLEAALGTALPPELLEQALTHRSYAYENGGLPTNERLEFLGDAVLGLVVTDALYRRSPELPEGQLAPLRASVVNTRALADVARGIGLGPHVRLGKGESVTGGADKTTILADTLEALIGAVYLAHGMERASSVVRSLVAPLLVLTGSDASAGRDWKTALQELAAAHGTGAPEYLLTESGPDHAKRFVARVRLGGQERGTGRGRSKKEAEQAAARAAVEALEPTAAP